MTSIGTLPWATRRRGELTFAEQVVVARQSVSAHLAALPGAVRFALFGSGSTSPFGERRPPVSELAAEALDLITSAASTAILQHSLRCWYFADLFAQRDGIVADSEAVYLACLLHDLALTDDHRPDAGAGCFAVDGATKAVEHLRRHGASVDLCTRVGEAISLHVSPRVALEVSVEGHLLNAAASLDVAGYRIAHLPREALAAVLDRHPREDFARVMSRHVAEERRLRPRSRAAVLHRLGSSLAFRMNPLDRIEPRSLT